MGPPPATDRIDRHYVPTPHGDVVAVPVGDEMVLGRGVLLALNRTATLVWRCFDGESSLEEIADDLSGVVGGDAAVLRPDVITLTRRLAGARMLESPLLGDARGTKQTTPRALETGDLLEPFTLLDLDGVATALASFAGRRVLLVNWNIWCGPCKELADELRSLRPQLESERVELVVLTSGLPDAIRTTLAGYGIDSTVLLREDMANPFKGFGSPAAYLLGPDGRVTAPFAYGAREVALLARNAAGVGAPASAAEDRGAPRYLPAAAEVCNDVAAARKPIAWEGKRVYRLDDFHVGIRYDTEPTAEVLDRLFAGHEVIDEGAPDNYSVALSQRSGRTRDLNFLVRGADRLVRSRSAARVLSGLLAFLSSDLSPPDASLLQLRLPAAVGGGEALLLPSGARELTGQLESRLSRAGVQLVDRPVVLVDPSTAELVVPEPTVGHEPAVLDSIDRDLGLTSDPGPLSPGRYRIRSWLMECSAGAEGPITGALAVALAGSSLVAATDQLSVALSRVALVTEALPPSGISWSSPAGLAAHVSAALA
ncbi:MAG: PqqD family peptide modification chaperone [Acidimicrobiales bacterium]